MAKKKEYITISGARVNNLKNISLKIPRNAITVITGVSGSGKSSLAFDTLYAESQRRFAESLSSFARQFLGRMSKPDVDKVDGIPPAIAIGQRVASRNPRSTVGTTTEIYDYLRILFSKIGRTYSPISGKEVKRESVEDVIRFISQCDRNLPLFILNKIELESSDSLVEKLLSLSQSGYSRLYLISQDGKCEVLRIDKYLTSQESYKNSQIFLLLSRYATISEIDTSELRSSIEEAFSQGGGKMSVAVGEKIRNFSNIFEADGIIFPEPTPHFFSFNNPLGACPHCGGSGEKEGIDEKLVIPNASLSVYEGCVAPWRGKIMSWYNQQLIDNAKYFNFPIHRPYANLTKEQRDTLWYGNSYFDGIYSFFDWVESKKYKIQYRYLLSRYRGKSVCKECGGSRLRKEVRNVKVGGKDITELLEMSIKELRKFFENLSLPKSDLEIAQRGLKEIMQRLEYIDNVGLGYLTLNRKMKMLSGGEAQRINLAANLGSSLVGSLYILDEPSMGLHPSDTQRLLDVIKKLRDIGNTIVIVEHDIDIIRSADYLVDIGPLAGSFGGEIVYQGSGANPVGNSLTLDYLNGKKSVSSFRNVRPWRYAITIEGAMEHNLKNLSVDFPLGVFTVVTGVSGSGKSSLVGDVLYPALCRHFDVGAHPLGAYKSLSGDLSKISGIEYIGQTPIGKSTRSNPVTYLKIYDDIRKLFSDQPYAKLNGFTNSYFSFNQDGGRCPVCLGEGYITVPMQFMADVQMVCEECQGKRFKQEILEVRYKGKSINDILNMSVDQAIEFFSLQSEAGAKRVVDGLSVLQSVGLGYIQLGQSSSTLSGGENQRVMLAHFLSKHLSQNSKKLYIFDEPTTGLHFDDTKKLLEAFDSLVNAGNTLLVVEHNTDVIRSADWVIDLGPGSGDDGGQVVFTGTPTDLAKRNSWSKYLK